jgi:ABC-type bacteriocin/lantibiotic exporter with double-glycine peptidase domain
VGGHRQGRRRRARLLRLARGPAVAIVDAWRSPPDERRIGLRALGPYLRAHRATLVAVAVLSLVGAGGMLLQPLLTRRVLDATAAARPVGASIALLVGVLVSVALLGGVRDYLLKRTAEGLVLTARRRLSGRLLRLLLSPFWACCSLRSDRWPRSCWSPC